MPDCANCGLRAYHLAAGRKCVPVDLEPVDPDKPTLLLDAPFADTAKLGVSYGGKAVIESLRRIGKRAAHLNWRARVRCRLPRGAAAKMFRAWVRKRPEWSTPEEACHDTMHEVMSDSKTIICAGKIAGAAVMGTSGLEDIRGAVTPLGKTRAAIYTRDPGVVHSQQGWRRYFDADLDKAFRVHKGLTDWKDPEVIWYPRLSDVKAQLNAWKSASVRVAFDFETDGLEPLDANVRCLAIGTQSRVLMLGFHSLERPWEGESAFHQEETADLKKYLKGWFEDRHALKKGHNARVYDHMIAASWLGCEPKSIEDTILLAHLTDNEKPRGLGFWGAYFTDAPAWKSEHAAVTAKTDHELHIYCARDVAVSDRIDQPLQRAVKKRNQGHLYPVGRRMQDRAVGMHRLGLHVDMGRIYHHGMHWRKQEREAAATLREIAGDRHNPASVNQVRKFLYKDRGCYTTIFTDSGELSTSSDALREVIFSGVGDEVKAYCNALLRHRAAAKSLSTFVHALSPAGFLRNYSSKTGIGTLHPDFNSTGTTSGRYSSSRPNGQNLPYWIMDSFIAPDGYKLLYLDYDQIELRVVVGLADILAYKSILNGEKLHGRYWEPHNLTGYRMFGQQYLETPGGPVHDMRQKGSGSFKDLRDLVKTLYYLVQYGGKEQTMLLKVRQASNAAGEPLYPDLFESRALDKVRAMRSKLLKALPELPKWWDSAMSEWRRNGCVVDPIHKRRRDISDGDDPNATANHIAQAAGAAIVSNGLDRLHEILPFDFKSSTGIVLNVHDSVVVRVWEDDAPKMRSELEAAMYGRHFGIDFTGEAEVLSRLKPIKDEGWRDALPSNWKEKVLEWK